MAENFVGNDKEKELIWVSKSFVERHKDLDDKRQREMVLLEYMDKVAEQTREDYKATLESMKEDAVMYKGLIVEVKRTFEKVKSEQLGAFYEVWENFDKELPRLEEKIQKFTSKLTPLQEQIANIEKSIEKINTWNIDRLNESIHKVAHLTGTEKEMFEFLVNNFKKND